MKKQATDIVRDKKDGAFDMVKARRTRFVLTHLFIFLACLLVSLAIWLVVHYAEDEATLPETAGIGESITLPCDHLI